MKRTFTIFNSYFAPWLVLGFSLAITFLLWRTGEKNIELEVEARFQQEIFKIEASIIERLKKYELMLQGCLGLFNASAFIDRREWKMYVQALDPGNNYPGIQGIGFAKRVPAAEKEAHIRQLRTEGFPDYSIRPEGNRAEYFPIIYLEPFSDRNLRAFSYDMFSEPVRRAAMEQARDHGVSAMSEKVQLVQETAQNVQAGFLIYLPLYEKNLPLGTQDGRRAALRGFVYSPFRMDDFINGLITWSTAAVQWEVYDGPGYGADALLYRSGAAAPDTPDAAPTLHKKPSFELFGRTWSLHFRALPAFTASMDRSKLQLIVCASLIISFLLLGITFLIVARGKALALDMIRQKLVAEELRQTRNYLENLIDYANAPIITWDTASRITRFNNAFENLTGYAAEEVVGRELRLLFPQESLAESIGKIAQTSSGERWESVEIPIRRKDGDIRIVLWNSANIYAQDGTTLVATIAQGVDITERKRADEALRESEKRMQYVLLGSRLGFWDWDLTTNEVKRNERWAEMLGYDLHEIEFTVKQWIDFVHPDDQAMAVQSIQDHIAGRTPMHNLEYRMCMKDGQYKWILDQAMVVAWDGGRKPIRMSGTHTDITERKRAEEALKETQAILEAALATSQAGIAIADAPSGVLRFVNKAGLLIRGGDSQSAVNGVGINEYVANWQLFDLDGSPLQQDEVPLARAIMFGETCSREFIIRRGIGDDRIVLAKAAPIRDESGEVAAGIVVFMDITELKRMQNELQVKNDELIRFNYTVSHDLKSPLVTIKTFLGYLKLDMEKADSESIAKDLGFINSATDKMNRLLDELLVLSRIGHIENLSVEASLQEVVQEALDLAAGRIGERGVRVEVTKEPVQLFGNRVRLVEVFQNLVGNAVKFMGEQSEPLIEIGAELKQGEKVCFVRDNGMGIDPRFKDKLFGLFEKLNVGIEGSGIGLALVKQIVEVHGGRVWVETEGVGKGACFYFTLPGKQVQG